MKNSPLKADVVARLYADQAEIQEMAQNILRMSDGGNLGVLSAAFGSAMANALMSSAKLTKDQRAKARANMLEIARFQGEVNEEAWDMMQKEGQ